MGWVSTTGEPVASVQGTRVTWADGGSPAQIEKPSNSGQVVMRMDGETFEGKLEAGHRLVWSDGDIWVRDAGDRGETNARTKMQTEAKAQVSPTPTRELTRPVAKPE